MLVQRAATASVTRNRQSTIVGRVEEDLIERLRHGDERAFDRVFDAYRPRLFRFLVRLSGHPTLADLAPHLASQMGLPLADAEAPAAAALEEANSGPLNAALSGLDEMSEDDAMAALRSRAR